jgi:hypothetical protein
MSNNQGLRQASARGVSSTASNYDQDWLAMMAVHGVTTGTYNERLLAWINSRLAANYTNLPAAQQAYAVAKSANKWTDMGTFTP